ncbi:MAG: CehA/McbA family metallohydrolase [Planctomycetales bacterium]|nr:CehA/McbA family metallohydrolase [Planctomycetales bacterium]
MNNPFRVSSRVATLLSAAVVASVLLHTHSLMAQEATVVRELSAENWNALVPQGKEVDAIYGDTTLQNQYVKAVIAQPVATRNANMTVRNIGGCLIDLVHKDAESDQLSAFYPGRRAYAFSDLKTGDGSVTVSAEGSDSKAAYSVTWSLPWGANFLTAKSVWTNTTKADLTVALEDDVRADGGKEDMVKSPAGTHDLFWVHDIFWRQAYGIHAPGYRIRVNGNARESVLVYEPIDGKPVVLKPGENYELVRHIFVDRDLPNVMADYDESIGKGESLRLMDLPVYAKGRLIPNARVALSLGDVSRGTLVTRDVGLAVVRLPQGEYKATVSVAGRELKAQTYTVSETGVEPIHVDDLPLGYAVITITDAEGRDIPAKLQFKGKGETPTPNWAPETGEHLVKNLAYTANGAMEVSLEAGEYELTVSRGSEYHADYRTLKIEDGNTTTVSVKLVRAVETPGWVSADFHSHSSPSGDNTSSQLGRVLNLIGEHIEFAPCTEHNRISTYEHHLTELRAKAFMATVSGMELTGTPLPLNHQNVFPLIFKPRTQDGGAPVTDASPETQMERIAAWDNNSVKLIQQNHPDIGWLFYDRDGNKTPDEGYSRSFGLMNVMEIHPIDPLLKPSQFEVRDGKTIGNQTALNWLQLLNQGFRIYGVVNTDSHYNFHGSGGLKLWIKSSTDDPANINSEEMRDASREGHLIMSNGPYLEATFTESGTNQAPVISGQDLVAKSKKVSAKIRVQCPNWLDVDTVIVLVNGRRSNKLTFSRDTHPDMFGKDVVKFDHTVDVELTEDAHLVVLTGHRTQVLGDIMGPMWGTQHPTALSNPVFVDIAGDGFTANKDTLDIPLPVKFVAEK